MSKHVAEALALVRAWTPGQMVVCPPALEPYVLRAAELLGLGGQVPVSATAPGGVFVLLDRSHVAVPRFVARCYVPPCGALSPLDHDRPTSFGWYVERSLGFARYACGEHAPRLMGLV